MLKEHAEQRFRFEQKPAADGRHVQLPAVNVLMSTYNGDRYLAAQIDSILSQEGVDVRLHIRDDGSEDATAEILRTYEVDPRLRITFGTHMGVVGSFFALLQAADRSCEVFAFADQDDVWFPDKLRRAVRGLAPFADKPAIYTTRLVVTDSALGPRGITPKWPRPPCFSNALVENIVTGCAAALNRAALDLLLTPGEVPRQAFVHDWWAYIVVSAFGTVVFDPVPSLYNRQHGHNATGVGATPLQRLFRKIRRQIGGGARGVIPAQATEFRRLYRDRLTAAHYMALERICAIDTIRGRIRTTLAPWRWRQTLLDDVAFRALCLLGRI